VGEVWIEKEDGGKSSSQYQGTLYIDLVAAAIDPMREPIQGTGRRSATSNQSGITWRGSQPEISDRKGSEKLEFENGRCRKRKRLTAEKRKRGSEEGGQAKDLPVAACPG